MTKSIFYHAGCSVCVTAEQELVPLLGSNNVEVVHLGENDSRIPEAEGYGVQSVPALVTPNQQTIHLNFGAALNDLKN